MIEFKEKFVIVQQDTRDPGSTVYTDGFNTQEEAIDYIKTSLYDFEQYSLYHVKEVVLVESGFGGQQMKEIGKAYKG